ncbi:hypothetical protein ES703_19343 [subsurface metagenome]
MGVYRTRGIKPDLAIARLDRGNLEHLLDHRPRPTPYDIEDDLNLVADGVANTFGGYVELIAEDAYDFGDTPNCIRVTQAVLEDISANDKFILEFYAFNGVATYVPLGAIRFARLDIFTRSFIVDVPCRCLNIDDNSLVGRLKSGTGGGNVDISLSVVRILHTDYEVPISLGAWPTG